MKDLPRSLSYGLMAALVLFWGGNWPIMKLGVAAMTPFWFGGLRFALGALCLFAFLALRGSLAWPRRGDWPVILSVGLLQMAAFLSLVHLGLEQVPAGRSAVLAYTTPLWVAPGAALLLGEKFGWRKLLGLALGLVGLAILFAPWSFDWRDGGALAGNLYLMAAAFCWALVILHIRHHRWVGSALETAPWQMLVAALPLLAIGWLRDGWLPFAFDGEAIAILAFNGPIATAFCYWAALSVTRSLPPVTASLAFLAVPAWGLAASALALGEAVPLSLAIGFAAILAGLAVVESDRRLAG